MPSFKDQIASATRAHGVVNALEEAAREQITQTFDGWDSGLYDARTVRYRLESIVRDTYRGSVALAVAQTTEQAAIPGWKPQERVFVTPYLTSLIADVRKNLRDFKKEGKTEEARRRAILRMRHSAGVAAQRGYTDAVVRANVELASFGMTLRKFWVSRLSPTYQPCPQCTALHGTEVGLEEEFPTGEFRAPYLNLLGPPAHPHCKCWLVVLTVALENVLETPGLAKPESDEETPTSMTAKSVRSLSGLAFLALLKFITKVVGFVGKAAKKVLP